MHKNRIEAFSDGVIDIIITIMVLELKIPRGHHLADLLPLAPVAFCYFLSFIYLAIYWNNHHHLFQAVSHVTGAILWANIHLLFWLSLFPFVTSWAGESHFSEAPTVIYGIVLFMAGASYYILTQTLIKHHGKESVIAIAVGPDFKGKCSIILYGLAIPMAYWSPVASFVIYVLVAAIWVVPDDRIENQLQKK